MCVIEVCVGLNFIPHTHINTNSCLSQNVPVDFGRRPVSDWSCGCAASDYLNLLLWNLNLDSSTMAEGLATSILSASDASVRYLDPLDFGFEAIVTTWENSNIFLRV